MIAANSVLGQPELAGLGERFVARAVDSLVAYCPMLIGLFATRGGSGFGGTNGPPSIGLFMLLALVTLGYLLFADAAGGGQSLGKRLLSIKVVDAQSHRPCTYGQSFVRNLCLSIGFLDVIFILGSRSQRLGDKGAGTIVVRA